MEYADSQFEIKGLDEAGHIEGLAAGFGDVDRGGDKILHGAFTKTLAARGDRPIPMLFAHDHKRPIGAWKSWEERSEGLYVRGKMSLATRDAQEAHALAKDGALTGLSIGWGMKGPARFEGGARVLPDVELFEISPVPVAMHDRTRIALVKEFTGAGDIADVLRERGFSGRKAKEAAGLAWKIYNSKDDEAADAELAALIRASTARLSKIGVN
jgi:HK97 family phage prohead protease